VLSLPPPPGPLILPAPPPIVASWFHPLAGPRRMPMYATRRFGAARPQPRPRECELGHCGVDIGSSIGEPVYAVFDGVVDRIQRNPDAEPISGIYVILSHQGGSVRSRYIHLDSVPVDLAVGAHVHGGQLVGRLGRTGVHNSGPHLHFGLSLREHGRETFIDPEPYLRTWALVDAGAPDTAVAAISPLDSRHSLK
jgi:murein DD-endopeptidase MepM/ murein hydrolase activator NlpD